MLSAHKAKVVLRRMDNEMSYYLVKYKYRFWPFWFIYQDKQGKTMRFKTAEEAELKFIYDSIAYQEKTVSEFNLR